jgi:predicted negative regulator of RcsB-dependent stress response
VDENLSELERLEMVKTWWRENYQAIVAGALLAVVIVGGWRYWQYRTQSRSQAASTLFGQLNESITKKDGVTAQKFGDQLMNDYSDTPYAAQAALALAADAANNGKAADGVQKLEWVMQHSKDEGLKLLARLRAARLKLSIGDAQAAIAELSGVDADGFEPLYDELRGDAYVKLGKTEDARGAYKKALAAWTDALGDHSLLDMKLNSLPGKASKS